MGFGKDLKSGIDVMLSPVENTKKNLDIGAAYGWYYRVTLIPLIVLILVSLVLVSAFSASPIARILGSALFGLGVLSAVVLPILFVWVLVPISILVSGGLFHIVGMWSGQFKGTFSRTLTATMFSRIPAVVFLFLLIIPTTAVFYFMFALWSLVVLVLALANQQKVKWTVSFGVVLITVALVAAVVGLVATVFAITLNSALVNALLPHFISNNGYISPVTLPITIH